jgi:uracil-DNA glycosylase
VTAAEYVPETKSLDALGEAAKLCHGCDLWRNATQTVFGQGGKQADVMFVGEQPGDQEDKEGAPFVGPAGRMFDRALEEVGIDRSDVYVTNAVKHFKWQPRGKRRIHQKPNWAEMTACRPWLEAEIEAVHPRVVVPLGATAAQSLLGRDFRVTKQRGEVIDSEWAEYVVATIHPSAILRAEDRDAEYAGFVADLAKVAALL